MIPDPLSLPSAKLFPAVFETMATASRDSNKLNFLSLLQQSNTSYRSPKPHCLLYPTNYTTNLYPAPSSARVAGVNGGAGMRSSVAVSVLTSAGAVLPHSTIAAATNSSLDSSISTGDYKVRTHELIASPHSYYEVLELLGRGTFGQVLKCWKKDSNEVVAMKILKNLPSYSKQGQVEVDVLTTISKVDAQQFNFVRAYESFTHHNHICIVFELLNINLYDFLKENRFQPLPLKHIRPVAQQVLTCLSKLKELGLVHADLKPENIMLVDPGRQPFRVKVIDFGSATARSTSLSSTYLQSRYYRAPEVILGVPYTEAIDMWSLGCVLAELFLGWPLFPGATEYDQVLYITQMLGPPPPSLTKNLAKMCRFFRKDSLTGKSWELKPQALVQMEDGVCPEEMRKFVFTSVSAIAKASSSSPTFQPDRCKEVKKAELLDEALFISLLEMLLTFDPHTRVDPDSCLQHSFITMLHLSSHTDTQCVKEWIQCMHVCCHSRTSYSTPPVNHNHQPHLATPTHLTSLPPPPMPMCNYALDTTAAAYASSTHPQQPQFLHLTPHGYTSMMAPPTSSTLLVAPPTSSSLLVDTGYVSAESSPTLHTVWDLPTVRLGQQPVAAPPPTTLLLPPPSAALLTPSSATTYWLMLQQQQSNYLASHSRL